MRERMGEMLSIKKRKRGGMNINETEREKS